MQASGQRHGDWLVVDAVVSDGALVVERTAHHLPTDQTFTLPSTERTYVPNGDFTSDELGRLVYLDPTPQGLAVVEVTP